MQKIIVTIVGLVLVGSVTYGNPLPPTPEYSMECNNSLPPTYEYPVNDGRVYNSNK
jgi:hypothetical protein